MSRNGRVEERSTKGAMNFRFATKPRGGWASTRSFVSLLGATSL